MVTQFGRMAARFLNPETVLLVALVGGLCTSACTQRRGPLDRIARWSDRPNLDVLRGQFQAPLVLIGQAVYVPSCACLDDPCGRLRGGDKERREIAAAWEARRGGEVGEGRSRGQADEARGHGSALESRSRGVSGEARLLVATGEPRSYGSAVSSLECVRMESGAFRVLAPSNQAIRYFDGTAVRDAEEGIVRY